MKSLLTLSLVVLCVTAGQADVKADLQKLYNQLAVSVKKKDLKTCLSYLTSDYTDTDMKGKKSTRKEFEAKVQAQFNAPIKVKSFDIKVTKVTPKGADMIAESSSKMALTFVDPQTKKENKIEQSSTSRDVWTKMGAKWMLKSSATLTQKRFLNGKEFKG